jgi:dienelactone hydrolase
MRDERVKLQEQLDNKEPLMTTNAARTRLSTLVIAAAFWSACSSDEPEPGGTAGRQGQGGSVIAGTGGASAGKGGSVSAGTGGSVTAGTGGSVNAGTGGSVSAGTGGSGAGAGGSANGGETGGTAGSGGITTGGAGGLGGSGGAGNSGTSGAGGAAQGGSSGSGGAAGSGTAGTGGSPLPPIDEEDYDEPGPFGTTVQENTGPDGTYVIVRPQTLGENGFLHAPITFGPGTGMQVLQLRGLLERFASHGFVVIGRQLMGGPGDAATRMRMTAGLDWIIAQNTTAGSVFQGKIDVTHAVAMGYSVGGTGAVEIGGHEAIATVVSIHGHGAEGDLHSPLLLIGGTADVMGDGESWLAPTYEASEVQTFFGMVVGANHGYIQGSVDGVPGGVETPAIVAWLRYWIYNDQGAKNYFYGDDCVMCGGDWTNPQRKNWQ